MFEVISRTSVFAEIGTHLTASTLKEPEGNGLLRNHLPEKTVTWFREPQCSAFGDRNYCGVKFIDKTTNLKTWTGPNLHQLTIVIFRVFVDCVWNVMAHAPKPDFVFRRKVRVHLNWRERQFSRLLASRGVRISGSNAGYTMFRGSLKSTGYPLHSPRLTWLLRLQNALKH